MTTSTIFCDESGFTGTHLSDESQPYFVYASVAIPSGKADELVEKAIKDFRIQSEELKGSRLVKYAKGRTLLSLLLQECLRESQLILVEKKFALACKLFEYLFEPALSDKSSIFYALGFHKFVSTLLYAELQIRSASAESLFEHFERLMRAQGPEGIASFFEQPTSRHKTKSFAQEVLAFCHAQRPAIVKERKVVDSVGASGRWVLDVTDAALYSLLCYWGERYEELDVFCDESKPLFAYIEMDGVFSHMIGRKDKQYFEWDGTKSLLTFNLKRKISLVNSKKSRGIQIADAIAACLSYAVQNRTDKTAREWITAFDTAHAIHPNSIVSDSEYADVSTSKGALNKLLFEELIRRCRAGENLLDGIEDFVRFPFRP